MNFGLIVAAGKSARMGSKVDKAFLSLGNKPVLAYSLLAYENCDSIDGVVLVVRKDRVDAARSMAQMFGCQKVTQVIAGGTTRQKSVQNGLNEMSEDVTVVAVHDGARPCIEPDLISQTIKCAKRYGSGVAAMKITDTIKYVEKGYTVKETIDRTKLWSVQTPQTFKLDLLNEAFVLLKKKNISVTDESSAVELTGHEVRLVPGSLTNIKITTPDDLQMAAALMGI